MRLEWLVHYLGSNGLKDKVCDDGPAGMLLSGLPGSLLGGPMGGSCHYDISEQGMESQIGQMRN